VAAQRPGVGPKSDDLLRGAEPRDETVARNFHSTPFDEGTLAKLNLFGDYIREWLPVWLSSAKQVGPITIADFFAGPGRDLTGRPGSPLVALAHLRSMEGMIRARRSVVRLELNEIRKAKAATLREVMEAETIPPSLCSWEVHNRAFSEAFDALYPRLEAGPNLLIMDQEGMKAISDEVFMRIVGLRRTDFLFFIASSSIRRFVDHPHFRKHLAIPVGSISTAAFNNTHGAVTDYYRGLAASADSIYLGTFSLKKGSNLYGVIFGSRHPLGLEKFLRVCWRADQERGEANFDIDDDRLDPRAPSLFRELNQPKKRNAFEAALMEDIVSGNADSDSAVYLRTLQEGFLPSHGKTVLRALVKEGRVRVIGGQPRVSKDGFADPRKLEVVGK
jgi:three-Cys-motif partner protein